MVDVELRRGRATGMDYCTFDLAYKYHRLDRLSLGEVTVGTTLQPDLVILSRLPAGECGNVAYHEMFLPILSTG